MEGNEFVFKKEGTTLYVYLGFELSIANSAALREMFEGYRGQDISKIVFDATDLVFLSSSGIRVIIFVTQEIGKQPMIVFVNCAEEIQDTFKITGLANFFSFVEDKSKNDHTDNDEAEDALMEYSIRLTNGMSPKPAPKLAPKSAPKSLYSSITANPITVDVTPKRYGAPPITTTNTATTINNTVNVDKIVTDNPQDFAKQLDRYYQTKLTQSYTNK